jgi:hypothetical protein
LGLCRKLAVVSTAVGEIWAKMDLIELILVKRIFKRTRRSGRHMEGDEE